MLLNMVPKLKFEFPVLRFPHSPRWLLEPQTLHSNSRQLGRKANGSYVHPKSSRSYSPYSIDHNFVAGLETPSLFLVAFTGPPVKEDVQVSEGLWGRKPGSSTLPAQ